MSPTHKFLETGVLAMAVIAAQAAWMPISFAGDDESILHSAQDSARGGNFGEAVLILNNAINANSEFWRAYLLRAQTNIDRAKFLASSNNKAAASRAVEDVRRDCNSIMAKCTDGTIKDGAQRCLDDVSHLAFASGGSSSTSSTASASSSSTTASTRPSSSSSAKKPASHGTVAIASVSHMTEKVQLGTPASSSSSSSSYSSKPSDSASKITTGSGSKGDFGESASTSGTEEAETKAATPPPSSSSDESESKPSHSSSSSSLSHAANSAAANAAVGNAAKKIFGGFLSKFDRSGITSALLNTPDPTTMPTAAATPQVVYVQQPAAPQVVYVQQPAPAAQAPAATSSSHSSPSVTPTYHTGNFNRPVADKWGLVIGISKFNNPQYNLKYAAKDAQDFYNYLITEGHFQKDHVLLLLDQNATRRNIMAAFGDKFLPAVSKDGDLITIYVSTHGTPSSKDPGKRNFIVAYDTEAESLYETGVDMDELNRRVKEGVKTDRCLIVMDTCYSGAGVPGARGVDESANFDAQQIAQGFGHLVMSSSSPNERSWESKVTANGVFTKYLLQHLKETKGNVKNAFEKVKGDVGWEVQNAFNQQQHPQLGGDWSGKELNLAAIAKTPRSNLNPDILKLMSLQH